MPEKKPIDIPKSGTWAHRVNRGEVNLADLEVHVFKRDPRFVEAFGRRTINDGPPYKPSMSTQLADWLLAILVLLTFLGPLAGACAFFSGREGYRSGDHFDISTAIFLANICFYVSMPGPLGVIALWLRRSRLRDVLSTICIGAAVLCGVITIAMMALLGAEFLPTSDSATLPVWIVTFESALVAVAVYCFSAGTYQDTPVYYPVVGPVDEAKVSELVAGLDPRDKGRLRAERSRALNTLVERGVISTERKEQAEACEMGTLHTLQT